MTGRLRCCGVGYDNVRKLYIPHNVPGAHRCGLVVKCLYACRQTLFSALREKKMHPLNMNDNIADSLVNNTAAMMSAANAGKYLGK